MSVQCNGSQITAAETKTEMINHLISIRTIVPTMQLSGQIKKNVDIYGVGVKQRSHKDILDRVGHTVRS